MTRSCVLRCLVLVPCLVAIASVSVTTLSVDLSSTGCRRGMTNWQPNLSVSPLWLSEPLLMLVTLGLICSWFSFCRDASTPRSWKPLPVTTRNYEDLLAATLDQGAGQPTAVQALAALKDYPTGPAAIHSVGNLGKPREVKTHLGLCLYSSLGLARAAASVSCGPILTWAVSSAKVLTAGLIWDASLVGIAPPGPRNRSALTLASASLGRAAAKERPPGFL